MISTYLPTRTAVRRAFAVLLLLSLFPAWPPAPAQARLAALDLSTPIVVTTLALANDPSDGHCDLWEALKANFNQKSTGNGAYHECTDEAGPTIITFDPALAGQTIQLPAADPYPEFPFINDDVTIMGPITIDGGGQSADQHIFQLSPDGTLTLVNLTLTNGFSSGSGGAILATSGGVINLIGVSMIGNTAESNGGAIEANGEVNIVSSNFSGNRALGTRDGGVNDQPGTGFGGALSITGYSRLNIIGSTFNGNLADKGGGALYFSGQQADLTDVTFNGNIMNDLIPTGNPDVDLRGGGAVQTDPNSIVNFSRVAFDGNMSLTGHGGAMYTAIDGVITIADSSFNANFAGDASHTQMGGGIYNGGATLNLTRSVFLLNIATGDGGGLANDRTGQATLSNLTFYNNDAVNAGAALWNGQTQTGGPASTLVGYNLTLAEHDAPFGGLYNQEDGDHTLSLANVIIQHGVDPANNCSGPITSLGYNLETGASCGFSSSGDLSSTDPQLQGLAFNGGALPTLLSMKLDKTSPAVDSGNDAICLNEPVNAEDQRGEDRPQDGSGDGGAGCDRGALENDGLKPGFGSLPVQPGPLDFGSTTFGNSIMLSFDILETGNDTLYINNAALSGPNASEFSAGNPLPMPVFDGEAPKPFYVFCNPLVPTPGERTATLTLSTNDPEHPTVDYHLTCNASEVPVAGFASDPAAPGPLDFGAVLPGAAASASGLFLLEVMETGNQDLTLSNPEFSGANPADFSLATPFPVNIPDGTSVQLSLECNPQDYGIRTASLAFQTNDPAHPNISFDLACEGVAPPPPVLETPGQSVAGGGIPALDAPYGIAISPDGQHVYAAGYDSDSISTFERNGSTGELTWIQSLGDPDNQLDGAWRVLVSPDGQTVYVSAYLSNSVVTYRRDPASGFLEKINAVSDGDGYGCLPLPCDGFVDGLAGAYGMAISPDGRFFYASGVTDDGLVVLRRNQDGTLRGLTGVNFVQSYINSTDLNGAYGIALSPDGAHLYATGYSSDTLLIFRRDALSGEIMYVSQLGAGDVPGLDGVFRVIVSADGQFVYASSWEGDSVVVFRRNAGDGLLTHLATYTDGVDGVQGLNSVTSVAISPDGEFLFASAHNSQGIAAFDRDPQSGLLTFVQFVQRDGGSGLPALNGARDVVVSPEGSMLLATGYLDDRVVALKKANPIPQLESLSPASAQEGGSGFTLTVNGANFVPGAEVLWNGGGLATTYINPSQLTAVVPASAIASAGTANVTVVNPGPGGGLSVNDLEFQISEPGENPVPTIDTLLPQAAPAGGKSFTLVVNGVNFLPSSQVQWNGEDRPTDFISESELHISISMMDIAQPGPVGVRVFNPGPGGGDSNPLAFDVTAPGENPLPSLVAIQPLDAYSRGAGSQSFTLVVSGVNFVNGAQVYWNGSPRPTDFISSTELRADISGAGLIYPGTAGVTVVNPGPGGGESNALTFTILPLYEVFMPVIVR